MFRKNVAGQFVHFQGVDSTTGGIKSGVTWTVRRCIDGTFAAGGGTVTEDGSTGWYKYAMSQVDTNGNDIGFSFTGTGAVPQTVNIVTTAADPTDAVRLGLTALPNANAEAAGGLYTRGTGAGQINQPANGQIDANAVKLGGTTQTGRDIGTSVLLSSGTGTGQLDFTSGIVKSNLSQILGTALTETAGLIAAGFKKFFNVASPTGTVNSLPDAIPDASGGLPVTGAQLTAIPTLPAALVGGRIDASVGAMAANVLTASAINADAITDAKVASDVTIASVTGSVGSVAAGVTVTTNNDKTGYGLSAAAVLAIWDALTSVLTTAGSIGKWVVDKLDVVVSSRLAESSYTTPLDAAGVRSAVGLASANLDTQLGTIDDFLDTEIAAIKVKTDNLPASPAGTGDIPTPDRVAAAVRNNLTGRLSSNILFVETGGGSTGSLNLWDGSVTGSPTVDTTIKPDGAYSSLKFASNEELEAMVSGPSRRISFQFRLDALPGSGNDPFFELRDFNDQTIAFVTITNTGKLAWADPTLAATEEGNRVLSVNNWYQTAVCYNSHGTTDNLDLKIYLEDVEEVSVTGVSTNGQSFISETDSLHFFAGTSGRNIWIANVYVDDGSDLGYPGRVRCTAKFPGAVNVNDFDTTGGTGAVNERPLSETNYRQQAASTQVRQNYTLQGASEGDLDISGKTILGYMGWVWAKRGGGLGSQSTKLTLNGVDYAISLGGTQAIYRKAITDTIYPTNPAAIGLVSTGSSLDTFLYECGIVVAYIDPVFPATGEIADAVWDEDIVAAHTTADTAGKKLSQALILYEGN